MMYNDINDNGGSCTPTALKRDFIMNLGPDFSEIVRLQNMGTHPTAWQPTDLHQLIAVTKQYLQSVLSIRERNRVYKETHKPVSSAPKLQQSSDKPRNPNTELKDRIRRIYTSIYDNNFSIKNFEHEVGPGCCVFHGTRDHLSTEYML